MMMMLRLHYYWKHVTLISTILFFSPPSNIIRVAVPMQVSGCFVVTTTSRRLLSPLARSFINNHHRHWKQQHPQLVSSSSSSSSSPLPTTNNNSIFQCWAAAKSKTNPRRDGGAGSVGGGGFGAAAKTVSSASSSSKMMNMGAAAATKKAEAATMLKRLQQKYGGTTAQEIAQSTQQQIETAIQQLPSHVQLAIQIYQQLQKWNTHIAGLSLLEQATNISPVELDGAKRAQDELSRLYIKHNMTAYDVHNILQQITWDVSADAKAARAITGNMPTEIEIRIDRACAIVAETLKGTTTTQAQQPQQVEATTTRRVLDVGCGYGVLVPHLIKTGVQASQIYGVDLSPEMIRNAQEMHVHHDHERSTSRSSNRSSSSSKKNNSNNAVAGPTFEAADFLSDEYYGPSTLQNNNDNATTDGAKSCYFDAIIFCSSLHDMPDMVQAIRKASLLLRPGNTGSKLVIVHPQGASHVLNQMRANPALVTRGLPDAQELQALCDTDSIGMEFVMSPANAGSKQEMLEGYLAVLQKKEKGNTLKS